MSGFMGTNLKHPREGWASVVPSRSEVLRCYVPERHVGVLYNPVPSTAIQKTEYIDTIFSLPTVGFGLSLFDSTSFHPRHVTRRNSNIYALVETYYKRSGAMCHTLESSIVPGSQKDADYQSFFVLDDSSGQPVCWTKTMTKVEYYSCGFLRCS